MHIHVAAQESLERRRRVEVVPGHRVLGEPVALHHGVPSLAGARAQVVDADLGAPIGRVDLIGLCGERLTEVVEGLDAKLLGPLRGPHLDDILPDVGEGRLLPIALGPRARDHDRLVADHDAGEEGPLLSEDELTRDHRGAPGVLGHDGFALEAALRPLHEGEAVLGGLRGEVDLLALGRTILKVREQGSHGRVDRGLEVHLLTDLLEVVEQLGSIGHHQLSVLAHGSLHLQLRRHPEASAPVLHVVATGLLLEVGPLRRGVGREERRRIEARALLEGYVGHVRGDRRLGEERLLTEDRQLVEPGGERLVVRGLRAGGVEQGLGLRRHHLELEERVLLLPRGLDRRGVRHHEGARHELDELLHELAAPDDLLELLHRHPCPGGGGAELLGGTEGHLQQRPVLLIADGEPRVGRHRLEHEERRDVLLGEAPPTVGGAVLVAVVEAEGPEDPRGSHHAQLPAGGEELLLRHLLLGARDRILPGDVGRILLRPPAAGEGRLEGVCDDEDDQEKQDETDRREVAKAALPLRDDDQVIFVVLLGRGAVVLGLLGHGIESGDGPLDR